MGFLLAGRVALALAVFVSATSVSFLDGSHAASRMSVASADCGPPLTL